MAEWYASLSTLELVFFYIAIVGSVLLIIQIIMLLVSFGGAGDMDMDGDFDGDTDTDSGLSLFTIKSMTAFFAFGGWCGFAAASYISNAWAPILIAVATGVAAMFCVALSMRAVAKLQCSGNIVKEKMIGKTATVYVSVPPARSGRGKIVLTAQGSYTEIDAVTDENARIPVDERVKIFEYKEDFAVVGREKEKIAAEAKEE